MQHLHQSTWEPEFFVVTSSDDEQPLLREVKNEDGGRLNVKN
jgi:hypothetical protein